MPKSCPHEGPEGVALWFGRRPEHPAEMNREFLLLAVTKKRDELGTIHPGECGVRLSKEQAIRLAKNILEAVCELEAAAVTRADGLARAS